MAVELDTEVTEVRDGQSFLTKHPTRALVVPGEDRFYSFQCYDMEFSLFNCLGFGHVLA